MTDMLSLLFEIAPKVSGKKLAGQKRIIPAIAPHLEKWMPKYAINSPLRQAHFLAQLAHECDGFTTMEEYASGEAYEGRVKNLGNTQPGDGVKYKGHGLIQVTGRENHDRLGKKIGVDLINYPEKAMEPENAVRLACEFWKEKGLNKFADKDDITTITKRINGGLHGFADRKQYLVKTKRLLGYDPTRPVDQTEAEAAAAALTKSDIQAVQERLKALKYHEVGFIDGAWGGRTAAAVAAYKNDRGLAGPPVIDDILKADLDAAEADKWTRPIAAERSEGKPEDSRIVDAAEKQGSVGIVATVLGFFTWLTAKLGEFFEPFKDMLDTLRPIMKPLKDFVAEHWPIVLTVGGGFFVWQAARAWRARVQDHREGKTT